MPLLDKAPEEAGSIKLVASSIIFLCALKNK